jgi:hypothetical protein
LPTFLTSKLFIDFSREEQFEFSLDELARTLHGSPLYEKPSIGSNPFSASASAPTPKANPVHALLRVLAADLDTHQMRYSRYKDLQPRSGMSRVMFDVLLVQARDADLIRTDGDGDIWLLDKGKFYIVEHNLLP